jgi:hypothetical protein
MKGGVREWRGSDRMKGGTLKIAIEINGHDKKKRRKVTS